jgi:hypothetical protein
MRHLLRLGVAVFAAGCGLLIASCGYGVKEERLPETGATLEGKITYGAEQVPVALVIVAGDKGSATGYVDEATGRYKITNVPLGAVKIGVNTEAAKGEMQGKLMSGYYKGPDAKGKGTVAMPKIVDVPAKFSKPETSNITTTVNEGANTFDIEIPKK